MVVRKYTCTNCSSPKLFTLQVDHFVCQDCGHSIELRYALKQDLQIHALRTFDLLSKSVESLLYNEMNDEESDIIDRLTSQMYLMKMSPMKDPVLMELIEKGKSLENPGKNFKAILTLLQIIIEAWNFSLPEPVIMDEEGSRIQTVPQTVQNLQFQTGKKNLAHLMKGIMDSFSMLNLEAGAGVNLFCNFQTLIILITIGWRLVMLDTMRRYPVHSDINIYLKTTSEISKTLLSLDRLTLEIVNGREELLDSEQSKTVEVGSFWTFEAIDIQEQITARSIWDYGMHHYEHSNDPQKAAVLLKACDNGIPLSNPAGLSNWGDSKNREFMFEFYAETCQKGLDIIYFLMAARKEDPELDEEINDDQFAEAEARLSSGYELARNFLDNLEDD